MYTVHFFLYLICVRKEFYHSRVERSIMFVILIFLSCFGSLLMQRGETRSASSASYRFSRQGPVQARALLAAPQKLEAKITQSQPPRVQTGFYPVSLLSGYAV